MTLEEIKEAIAEIERLASIPDDEVAHSREDDLREKFIQFVANANLGEISTMATEVLKTNEINFARWCA